MSQRGRERLVTLVLVIGVLGLCVLIGAFVAFVIRLASAR